MENGGIQFIGNRPILFDRKGLIERVQQLSENEARGDQNANRSCDPVLWTTVSPEWNESFRNCTD